MTFARSLCLFAGMAFLPSCQTISTASPAPARISTQSAAPSSTQITLKTSHIEPRPAFSTNHPQTTGQLQHPELDEVSGLAASTLHNNVLWAINDGGNKAKIYAMNHRGANLGSFTVVAKNRDWEDMASASIHGESYLLIGDIGNNLLRKTEQTIYVVPEPHLDGKAIEPIQPTYTLKFRYPDKAHNAESMAFADGWIYILTKEPQTDRKRQASQVYRISMDLANQNQLQVATKIASLAIPSKTIEANLIASFMGIDVSQPTAFSIDQQNCYAYVLTYRSVYRYKRAQDQSWAEALSQPRKRIHTHSLSQAEALAVSTNGVVWITSEKLPAPLWALPSAKNTGSCND